MTPAPLLTEADVSAWLGIATETLRKMRRQGQIPFLKIGAAVRYDQDDVRRWLIEASQGGGSVTVPATTTRQQLAALHKQGLARASAR